MDEVKAVPAVPARRSATELMLDRIAEQAAQIGILRTQVHLLTAANAKAKDDAATAVTKVTEHYNAQIDKLSADLLADQKHADERFDMINALKEQIITLEARVRDCTPQLKDLVRLAGDAEAGRKIDVIKMVRALTGCGLKDAKNALYGEGTVIK